MRKLLFDRESACLQPLLRLIEEQSHKTLVLWALEYADGLAEIFEQKYPHEKRPREAAVACRAWAQGRIKMPQAKKAIHAAHGAASEIARDAVYCALARAVAQAVSTVHVETHAIGGPIYALTAIVHARGEEAGSLAVQKECDRLCERLLYWRANTDSVNTPWAPFLLKEGRPNKEKQLREKRLAQTNL